MKNYYQILGVNYDASNDEIKKAYRVCVSKIHPDKHKDDVFFNNLFLDVQEAYSVLSDDDKRSEYNDVFLNDKNDKASIDESSVRLFINKRNIKFGKTVTFVWETVDVENVEIVGHGYYPAQGTVEFTPTKTTEYTFLFSNGKNTLKKQVEVNVEKNYSIGAIIGYVIIGIVVYYLLSIS